MLPLCHRCPYTLVSGGIRRLPSSSGCWHTAVPDLSRLRFGQVPRLFCFSLVSIALFCSRSGRRNQPPLPLPWATPPRTVPDLKDVHAEDASCGRVALNCGFPPCPALGLAGKSARKMIAALLFGRGKRPLPAMLAILIPRLMGSTYA